MTELILGPMLRYVGETEATLWFETDSPCEVEVALTTAADPGHGEETGHRTRTFHVEGHHYALLVLDNLEPGCTYPYQVLLDGQRVWPEVGLRFPASAIRTLDAQRPLTLVFGSCREAAPHKPPYNLRHDQSPHGLEVDALYAFALRMQGQPLERWPHAMVLLGDQVYADETSPLVKKFIAHRRSDDQPPKDGIADFEEYTMLYRESWQDPVIRWLFSCVPSAMIFDDHDVHDDWNTSEEWVEEMRATDWWQCRIVGGLMSYWIYQHLGNLPPGDLAKLELLEQARTAEDAGPLLREFAARADHQSEGTRWSYCRDWGRTRLLMIDSRCGRVLRDGERSMLDEHEWQWVEDTAGDEVDHLLLATSLPWLLGHGTHYLEAWNEAVCGGAWGRAAARVSEKIRQGVDLEHWPAFQTSFERLARLVSDVASGRRGRPPATVVALSGDVHHAYLAEVDQLSHHNGEADGDGAHSRVFQAVCSPFRNPLDEASRRVHRAAMTPRWGRIMRRLARAAGVSDPSIRWHIERGPWFDNQIATLELRGRQARLLLEKSVADNGRNPRLELVLSTDLTATAQVPVAPA